MTTLTTNLVSTNPSKNYESLGEVPFSTLEEVQKKVAEAHEAKTIWRDLGLEGRISLLRIILNHFDQDKEELAQLLSKEMGKPIKEARDEIDYGLKYFRSYLDHAKTDLRSETTFEDGTEIHQVHREPYGVAAVIVAWNYPFVNFVWQCGENLVVGNTIVFKHSEETPLFGKAIEERMVKHLPKGVFSEVYGDGKVGQMLVEQNVDLICFTGSSKAGVKITELAAPRLIKTNMELGGSSPGIVFEDADIDEILPAIIYKRFSNCGQMCDALKRLIVHESKVDELVTKLKSRLQELKIGDPSQEDTDLGPLVAERQLVLLQQQMEDALQKGAKVLFGGQKPEGLQGAFYQPTLLTNITKDMRVWNEEVFGPVLPIVTFKSEQEAIDLANETRYGLGASIFTKDSKRFSRVAKQIESGMVSHNTLSYVHEFNPFGGYKMSGKGREHGKLGFNEVTQTKVTSKQKT